MATWSGWQTQLLQKAGEPVTKTNVEFMNLWAAHADSPGCINNPIDLSHKETGSSDCQALTGSRFSQRYASHASAATAYATEIHSGNFPTLETLLGGGKVDLTTGNADVEAELNRWGSTNFSTFLAGSATGGPPTATSIHHGWDDVRKSLNHRLPSSLSNSDRLIHAALRELQRARKVRL